MKKPPDTVEVLRAFYVRLDWAPKDLHLSTARRVLAESAPHHKRGWITVGFVSKQSPRGQGVFIGFPREWLRPASKKEILRALTQDHPQGSDFFPLYQDTMTSCFQLAMSSAFRSRPNNNAPEAPVHDTCEQSAHDEQVYSIKDCAYSVEEWPATCECQAEAIRSALEAVT
jgi:hypothetical protein